MERGKFTALNFNKKKVGGIFVENNEKRGKLPKNRTPGGPV
jgi:hypothetical protein